MYLLLFVIGLVLILLVTFANPVVTSFIQKPATEYVHYYEDPRKIGEYTIFPSVFDPASVYLSLIIPAYNEETRLKDMMQETMEYLANRKRRKKNFTYEVIIVDDGSTDRTSVIVMEYVKQYTADVVRLLKLQRNQGKGGAVQQGMLHARGEYLLMVDADGATRISDFDKVEKELKLIEKRGMGIAVGSRAHLQGEAVKKRSCHRNLLMYGFHFLVSCCVKKILDTQCGFKLFTRRSAQILFMTQHLRRWCFDVELLFVAQQLGMPIVEVEVNWSEIPGSKVDLMSASITMARDLLVIGFCYTFRIWKIKTIAEQVLKTAKKQTKKNKL